MPCRLEPRQRRFADLAVHHAAGMSQVAKQKRNIEDGLSSGANAAKDH